MFEIFTLDARKYLESCENVGNVFTGLPDMNEMKIELDDYIKFFEQCVELIMSKLRLGSYAVFCQTDRKYNRSWIDKSYLLSKVAERVGLKCCWHKIVLLRDVGKTNLYRPTYSHLMCFSRDCTTGIAFPDVFPTGKRLYENGLSIEVVDIVLEFLERHSKDKTLLDPFAGRGTIPWRALLKGFDVTAIDINDKQTEKILALVYA